MKSNKSDNQSGLCFLLNLFFVRLDSGYMIPHYERHYRFQLGIWYNATLYVRRVFCCTVLEDTLNYKQFANWDKMKNHLFYIRVFHDTRFCQIIWQISTQGRAKFFLSKMVSSGVGTQDLQIFTLHSNTLYKVMLYWFQKWTKSNMWSGARNKKTLLQKFPAQQIPA